MVYKTRQNSGDFSQTEQKRGLVGGIPTPLKNISQVSWDYSSQYMETYKMFQIPVTTNQRGNSG